MRRAGFLATIGTMLFASMAAAIAPIPTPVPLQSARPLVVNRPIFATSAPVNRAATVTRGNSALLKHRQPLAAPVKKDAAAKQNAAPAMPVNRSTPLHRQPLGW